VLFPGFEFSHSFVRNGPSRCAQQVFKFSGVTHEVFLLLGKACLLYYASAALTYYA